MTIPVAGAGLGDQFRSGTPSVVNATRSLAPRGWSDSAVGKTTSLRIDGEVGAAANLNFEQGMWQSPLLVGNRPQSCPMLPL